MTVRCEFVDLFLLTQLLLTLGCTPSNTARPSFLDSSAYAGVG